jgi:hypothetical protein
LRNGWGRGLAESCERAEEEGAVGVEGRETTSAVEATEGANESLPGKALVTWSISGADRRTV